MKVDLSTFLLGIIVVVLPVWHYAVPIIPNAAAFEDVQIAIDKDSLVFNIPYQSTGEQNITLHGLDNVQNVGIAKSDLRDDLTGATIDSSKIQIFDTDNKMKESVSITNGQKMEISVSVTAAARGNFEGNIWFLSNDGRATSVPITLDTGPYWEAILIFTLVGYFISLGVWNAVPKLRLKDQFEGIKARIDWIKYELDHFKPDVKIFGSYFYIIDDNARHLLRHLENSEIEEAEGVMKSIEETFADMIDPKNLDIRDDNMLFNKAASQKASYADEFISILQSMRKKFQEEMTGLTVTKDNSKLIEKIKEQHKPDKNFDQIVEEIRKKKFDFDRYLKTEWERSVLVNILTFAVGLTVALSLIFQNDYLNSVRTFSGNLGIDILILIGIGAGIESAKQLFGNITGK